jgi:hypothetical protein
MGPFVQEIARQRHQDLLGDAERQRLARIVRDSNRRGWLRSVAHAESKPTTSAETAAVGGRPTR